MLMSVYGCILVWRCLNQCVSMRACTRVLGECVSEGWVAECAGLCLG